MTTSHTDLADLAAGLASDDESLRHASAERLLQLGPDAAPAAIAIVSATATDDEVLLEHLVGALESIEHPLASDVDRLAALLSADEGDVGYWAATLLGRLGDQAAPAVPALAAGLGSPVQNTRHRSAWALGRIGTAAAAAVPALERATRDDDPRLARLATKALDQVR